MALTKHLRNKDCPVRVFFTQRLPNTRAPMNRNGTWAPGEALVLPASEAGYPSGPTSPLATWAGDGGRPVSPWRNGKLAASPTTSPPARVVVVLRCATGGAMWHKPRSAT